MNVNRGSRRQNDASNESRWWESPSGLHTRNEVHEKKMRHNAERKIKGEEAQGEDGIHAQRCRG
jgi:hypothetical protein